MDYSTLTTLPNLAPGSQGTDVKKLQTWLIQNGFNIPDGATGYYGPETKAAVTQWQQASGIDTAGNPGYFGPRSKTYAQTQLQGGTSSSTSQSLSQDGIDALHFLGFSDAQIKAMSPSDRQNFAATATYLKKQTDLGNITAENNAASLQKAYMAALNDPDIKAKYGDIQKLDQANFNSNLQAFQKQTDVDTANQKLQFEKQQKDLSAQAAAAGQAYSGFRGQAKQILDTEQSGVVKSSMSQIKQNLQSQLSPLEAYYGSSRLSGLFPNQGIVYNNPLGSPEYIGYNQTGGITGTEAPTEKADVANRQSTIYQGITSPI